jgi:hypothetical protein
LGNWVHRKVAHLLPRIVPGPPAPGFFPTIHRECQGLRTENQTSVAEGILRAPPAKEGGPRIGI